MMQLESVRKSFGGVVAANDVSLKFPMGSLSAIIGPNGAGKTTLFNLITGHLVPDEGRISVDGQTISGLHPHAIAKEGVGRAFQIASVFPSLTVKEALIAAASCYQGTSENLFQPFPPAKAAKRAEELLDLLDLTSVGYRLTSEVSHGDQKLLDIGLALALDPKVLLLDEPTAGMGPEERWQMIRTVQRLWRNGGMTLIFIEHDMDIVFEIAQTIHVLRYGQVIASGDAAEIKSNNEVIEAYLGADHGEAIPVEVPA